MLTDDLPVVQLLVVLISAIGAINWGLVEMFDVDLLVEIGLGADMLTIAYLIVGAAGVVLLVDMLELVAEGGTDSTPLED
ncbi:DUF378 domain-containing protein [Halapricum hydrolyticum]|uniref:DUF378 domain-containing protein n=1 Tax=Halapricum hydrolyticum TaxID=2979991 RepID=A0AAE3I9M7_9EURY|nr:DUF378 domain-containing protein [Halapricum hydrolyticum]MCU4716806.1 DUF378 domain-containing protein [Halapricum hydrolyticum]MCU4725589.1 DUF378 domain-containing protein [Halapricum hydrolyticum]